MPARKKPTAIDNQVLEAIGYYMRTNGFSPTRIDLAEQTGLHLGSVLCALLRLRRFKLVTWIDGKARTIRLAA